MDWIDKAAQDIVNQWNTWWREAREQPNPHGDAGEAYMRACVANHIRWLRANHSRPNEG